MDKSKGIVDYFEKSDTKEQQMSKVIEDLKDLYTERQLYGIVSSVKYKHLFTYNKDTKILTYLGQKSE